MSMRKTSVDIDEALLEEARHILEADTIKETVNAALREVVRAKARREEVRALRELEGLDLDDDEVMSRAWRG